MRRRMYRSILVPRVVQGIPKIINRKFQRIEYHSFSARGSGEGLIDESMDGDSMGLDSTDEDSSTHDMTFSKRGLDTTMQEMCFSRMWSRIFFNFPP